MCANHKNKQSRVIYHKKANVNKMSTDASTQVKKVPWKLRCLWMFLKKTSSLVISLALQLFFVVVDVSEPKK